MFGDWYFVCLPSFSKSEAVTYPSLYYPVNALSVRDTLMGLLTFSLSLFFFYFSSCNGKMIFNILLIWYSGHILRISGHKTFLSGAHSAVNTCGIFSMSQWWGVHSWPLLGHLCLHYFYENPLWNRWKLWLWLAEEEEGGKGRQMWRE